MSLKRDYKGINRGGPGGIACPCCNEYNCHPRNMKHLVRRRKRRQERQKIKHLASGVK